MNISFIKSFDFRIYKYFIVGFFFAATIHILINCTKDPVSPTGLIIDDKIEESALNIENAFITGDSIQVKSILTETALTVYGAGINSIPSQELIEFGEALKTRELDAIGDMYGEYSYSFKGNTYSIGLAQQEDGSWKLMRL